MMRKRDADGEPEASLSMISLQFTLPYAQRLLWPDYGDFGRLGTCTIKGCRL